MFNPSDVVVVDFPGATGIKRRPAVVISSPTYYAWRPDVVVCLITGQAIGTGTGLFGHGFSFSFGSDGIPGYRVILSTERMSNLRLLQNSPIFELLFRLFGFDAATYLYFAEELIAPAGKTDIKSGIEKFCHQHQNTCYIFYVCFWGCFHHPSPLPSQSF